MLDVRGLSLSYGQHRALEDVTISVASGEIVVILGANGAGKSTLLRAISGICEGQHTGAIEMDQRPIIDLKPDEIVERGIALVPEGRGIFGDLNVHENLILGAHSKRARENEATNLDRVISLFPKLGERKKQIARTMSGGEQQMVAIGRAMMSNPSILMLDEPSLGLSPLLCKELFQNLREICKAGIGILLVEQNAKQSLAIADRGYLLENAHIVHEDSAQNLARDPAVQKAYLGVGNTKNTQPPTVIEKPTQSTAPLPDQPTGIPPALKINSSSAQRRSAAELIGSSIDDLVASAAGFSRKPASSAPLETLPMSSKPLSSDHESKLRTTLSEIKHAASDARRDTVTTKKDALATMRENKQSEAQHASDPPVVIEVFRAPRVEVWRRQSGKNNFEKDPTNGGKNAG